MIADGMRMAHVLEGNGYNVRCFYCVGYAQLFGNDFKSMEGDTNWLLDPNTGQPFVSELGNGPFPVPNKGALLAALGNIGIGHNDEVAVYIRSHGVPGVFIDPTGAVVTYAAVFDSLGGFRVTGEALFLLDACFSGSVELYRTLFLGASSSGFVSQFVTSAPADETSKANYPVVIQRPQSSLFVAASVSVKTSSHFRHRLIELIQRRVKALTATLRPPAPVSVSDIANQLRRRTSTNCRYFSFGIVHTNLFRWFVFTADEPEITFNSRNRKRARTKLFVNAFKPPKKSSKVIQEDWVCGWFRCPVYYEKEVRGEAWKERERFCLLVGEISRTLRLAINRKSLLPMNTLEDLEKFQRILEAVEKVVDITGPWFVPDVTILANWISSGADVSSMLRVIEGLSQREVPTHVKKLGRSASERRGSRAGDSRLVV